MSTTIKQVLMDTCSLEAFLIIGLLVGTNQWVIRLTSKHARWVTCVGLIVAHFLIRHYSLSNSGRHNPSKEQSYGEALDVLQSRMSSSALLVSIGIITPIVEELHMQFILGALRHITRGNEVLSTILSSGYFAFLHVFSWHTDWRKFLFVGGLRMVGYKFYPRFLLAVHVGQNLLCASVLLLLKD